MSRYCGNFDECPACGLRYRDLRTGLNYYEVYLMLWVPDDDSKPMDTSEWQYKRRGTVLGKWHQIKQEMWRYHLRECTGPTEVEDNGEAGDFLSPWDD